MAEKRRRVAWHGIALVTLALLAAPLLPPVASTGAAPGDGHYGGPSAFRAPDVGAGRYIRLEGHTFDPLSGVPAVETPFRSPEDARLHLIQFTGPVKDEWKGAVESLGFQFLYYVPDYAFIMRGDAANLPLLSYLPFVRWSGPFHPAFRISPHLTPAALHPSGTDIVVNIIPADGEDAGPLAYLVAEAGGAVAAYDRFGVIATVPEGLLPLIASSDMAAWIEPYLGMRPFNDATSRIDKVRQNNDGAFNLNNGAMWSYNPATGNFEGYIGTNLTVAVADTGVDGTHPAFPAWKKFKWFGYSGEAAWTDNSAGGGSGHGTHTSGTVLGTGAWRAADAGGQAGKYAGMAPGAKLIGQAIFGGGAFGYGVLGSDAVNNGAVISSNSWGGGWYGDYDGSASAYDSMTRDASGNSAGKPLLFFFAAGNDGSGANTVSPPATAKNIVTVGASGNNKGGYGSGSVTGFSSRGPTDDSRIKPDVVAPGALLASTGYRDLGYGRPADGGSSYYYALGTSMACPAAAGAGTEVMDYWNQTKGRIPSPALTKALLINGADILTAATYPDNTQGWGRVNVYNSVVETASRKIFTEDQDAFHSIYTGKDVTYTMNVNGAGAVKISLVWTDRAAFGGSNPALVNNLDLTVVSPAGSTYMGNGFTSGQSSSTITNRDNRNNVEGFYLTNPAQGSWSVKVTGTNVALGPQDYALVISGPVTVTTDFIDLMPGVALNITPSPAIEGDTVTVTAKIKNNGTTPAPNVRYTIVHVSPGGAQDTISNNTFVTMLAGETKLTTVAWGPATRGIHEFRLSIDPLGAVSEMNELNNEASAKLTVRHYGVLVTAMPPTTVYPVPAKGADVTLSVRNTGDIEDYIRVSPPALPAGWTGTLTPDTVTLAAGGSTTVRYTVVPPAGASDNETAVVSLVATSNGNATYSDRANFTAVAAHIFGFTFTGGNLALTGKPGASLNYSLSLKNTGNGKDTITLEITGKPSDWPTELQGTTFPLKAGETAGINLKATIPATALAGTSAGITLTAHSLDGQEQSLTATARVERTTGLTVSADGDNITDAGGSLQFTLTLRNGGNANDTVALADTVPDSWDATFDSDSVKIPPFGTSTAVVMVKSPAGSLAGTFRVILSAAAESGLSQDVTLNVTVNQFHRVGLVAVRPLNGTVYPGGEAAFNVTVANYGNGPEEVTLAGSAPSDWSVRFAEESLVLQPGKFRTVSLIASSPSTASPGAFRVNVKAAASGASGPGTTNGTAFTVDIQARPAPPPPPPQNTPPEDDGTPVQYSGDSGFKVPLPLLLILLLLAAAAVGGGYGYARYSRGRAARLRAAADAAEAPPEDRQWQPTVTTQGYGEIRIDSGYTGEAAQPTPHYSEPFQSVEATPGYGEMQSHQMYAPTDESLKITHHDQSVPEEPAVWEPPPQQVVPPPAPAPMPPPQPQPVAPQAAPAPPPPPAPPEPPAAPKRSVEDEIQAILGRINTMNKKE